MTEADRWLRTPVGTEFGGAALGDERRTRRLESIANRAAASPDVGFPRMLEDEAELEAAYRLLSNDAITPDSMLMPHVEATLKRVCNAGSVLMIHDTTHFNFGGASPRRGLGTNNGKGQGFSAHVSLAVLPGEERLPLGVCSLERINRLTLKHSSTKSSLQHKRENDTESLRWGRAVDNIEAALPEGIECIHVMDREADAYDLLVKGRPCQRSGCAKSEGNTSSVGSSVRPNAV